MPPLSSIDWIAYRQRLAGRHKRILKAERAFHAVLLETGATDICIDCGANSGDYTAHMARTGARVHAFEPDPLTFAGLAARFADAPNVELHNAAIGCAAGTATLHRTAGAAAGDKTASAYSSLHNRPASFDPAHGVEVPVVDFAAFLDSLPAAPKMVKFDIEGAEVDILENLIAGGRIAAIGHVFVETHEKNIPRLRARTFAMIREVERRGWAHVNMDWA